MPVLILDQPGSTLGRERDMLYVSVPPATRENVPIIHLESVVVANRVQVTHDALMMLAERGIPILFLQGSKPLATFNPFAAHGMVLTRRAQILSYIDWRGAHLAKAFVRAGLENKARLLLHLNKYLSKKHGGTGKKSGGEGNDVTEVEDLWDEEEELIEDSTMKDTPDPVARGGTNPVTPEKGIDENNPAENLNINGNVGTGNPVNPASQVLVDAIGRIRDNVRAVDAMDDRAQGACADTVRYRLMGLEGEGASVYFGAIRTLLPSWAGFDGRNRRPPRDPFNACLSYGYAVLEGAILTGIGAAGLEPFAGFLHSDRSGKPSLVLDLIEEFRQPVVDRVALRLFRRRQLQDVHFDKQPGRVLFTEEGKRVLVGALYQEIRHGAAQPGSGGRRKGQGSGANGDTAAASNLGADTIGTGSFYRAAIGQARKLARFVLGQDPAYEPYLWKW